MTGKKGASGFVDHTCVLIDKDFIDIQKFELPDVFFVSLTFLVT